MRTLAEDEMRAAGQAYRAQQKALRAARVAEARRRREDRPYVEAMRFDPCAYCGGPGGVLDHIVPRHRGGESEPENCCGVCKPCNTAKGTRSLLAHLLIRLIDDEIDPLARQKSLALRL